MAPERCEGSGGGVESWVALASHHHMASRTFDGLVAPIAAAFALRGGRCSS